MPSLNTGNAILSNPIKVDSSYNVGIGGAASGSFKLQVTGTTNLTGALTGVASTFLGKLTIGNSSLAEGEIGIFETGGNYNFTTFKNGLVRTIIGSQSSTSQGFLGTASNHDLLLKTNDTTRLTISSTGAATFSSSVDATIFNSTSNAFRFSGSNALSLVTLNSQNVVKINAAGYWGVQLVGANDQGILINNTGNVGIGTSTPATAGGGYTGLDIRGSGGASIVLGNTSGINTYLYAEFSGLYVQTTSTTPILFVPGGNERMRITSSGSIGIGTTNPFGIASSLVAICGNGSVNNLLNIQETANVASTAFLQFLNSSGGVCGNVVRIALTNAVNYNTTSDYRLKEDLKEIKGLEKISAIKVYDFKWKDIEARMDGVIAHELAEILPYAVSGEKDGEKMQGVDYSKIVPVLIKAIQEQQAQIEAQQQQINSLINR